MKQRKYQPHGDYPVGYKFKLNGKQYRVITKGAKTEHGDIISASCNTHKSGWLKVGDEVGTIGCNYPCGMTIARPVKTRIVKSK